MRLLLDTHVVLWWLMDDPTLSPDLKDRIDTEADVLVSAASVWEIAIKLALGELDGPPDLPEIVVRSGLADLPIRSRHAMEAARPPCAASRPVRPNPRRASALRGVDPGRQGPSDAPVRRPGDPHLTEAQVNHAPPPDPRRISGCSHL